MKHGIFLALALFISPALLDAAESYQASTIVPPSLPREFRGAWIATVANKDWPSAPGLPVAQQKAELISLLDTAVRLKLNTVVFQVRSSCDAMYESPIEPWSQYLTGVEGHAPQPFYDPLAFAIAEAHQRGLELHAWFNPFRARFSPKQIYLAQNNISRTHPEWVRPYGGQAWLDPGDPAARDYVLRVVMDVVRRYDLDGVQFDDYFYPYPVPAGKGGSLPFNDDATWRQYGSLSGLSRDDWRRQNINKFIQSVYQNVKAAKPWVKFGVSPFGIWQPGYPPQIKGLNSYAELYSDSRLWLADGWLDYFSPQLYWPINSPGQSFPVLLNWWEQQNVRHRNLWPGLAAGDAGIKFPASEIAGQIQAARRQPGVSGEILFHLESLESNPSLAEAVAAEYAQPALVPSCPWLATAWPAKPQLFARTVPGGWMFQWSAAGNSPTARWLLQYLSPDNSWHAVILPAVQTAQTFSFSPRVVSVCAMDRVGDLGFPAVISESNIYQPTQSFWGSYKYK